MIKRLLLLLFFSGLSQAAFESYFAHKMLGSVEEEWYVGSPASYVGSAVKWPKYEPFGYYNLSSSSIVKRWDFEGTTDVDTANDLIRLPAFQLPNGTEVKFETTGELPAPLVRWKTDNWKVYCIVNSTPDDDYLAYNTADKGSFKVAEKTGSACNPSATPIDLTSTGSGTMKMSFLGYTNVIQYDVDPAVGIASINTTTDQITMNISPGWANNDKIRFLYDGTNTLPTGVVTHGFGATYCASGVSGTTLYLRQIWNHEATCVNSYPPGSNTLQITCNPSGGNANCATVASAAYMGETVAFKVVSIDSGSVANITAGTVYYTMYAAGTASSFAFAASPEEAMDSDKLLPDASFTATIEVIFKDFVDSGTNALLTSKTISGGSNTYLRKNKDNNNHCISGYPQGTTFGYSLHFGINLNVAMSEDWCGAVSLQEGSITVFVKVPANSTPGDYNIEVSFGPNPTGAPSGQKTFSYTANLIELVPLTMSSPTDFSRSTDFNTALSKWEQLMIDDTTGGSGTDVAADSLGCTPTTRTSFQALYDRFVLYDPPGSPGVGAYNYAFSIDGRFWFYQRNNFYLASTYQQQEWESDVADQINWRNCGDYFAYWYANQMVPSPAQTACCAPSGTESLYFAAGRHLNSGSDPTATNGFKYRHAIERQVQGAQAAQGRVGSASMREHSWVTDIWYHHYLLTGEILPYYPIAVSVNIQNLHEQGVGAASVDFIEGFISGLAMMTGMNYYQNVDPDPRYPVAVKEWLDKNYSEWLEPGTTRPYYNPLPRGKGCWIGCQQYTDRLLNAYTIPFYWAVWRWTGDSTYKDQGDEQFIQMMTYTVPGSGKQWNQLYTILLEYGIPWRLGTKNPW